MDFALRDAAEGSPLETKRSFLRLLATNSRKLCIILTCFSALFKEQHPA